MNQQPSTCSDDGFPEANKNVEELECNATTSCGCKKNCFESLGNEIISQAISEFLKLETEIAQNYYLKKLIAIPAEFFNTNSIKSKFIRMKKSFYYVEANGVKYSVCRRAFLSIYKISAHQLRKLYLEIDVQNNNCNKQKFVPAEISKELQWNMDAEEEIFYQDLFEDLPKIRNLRLHCTKCDVHLGCYDSSKLYKHLHLGILLCQECFNFYSSGDFAVGEDGSEIYCRWCGEGGTVMCCSNCPNVFCKKCISHNFSKNVMREIVLSREWLCFLCNFRSLWEHRAVCRAAITYAASDIEVKRKLASISPSPGDDAKYCCSIDMDKTQLKPKLLRSSMPSHVTFAKFLNLVYQNEKIPSTTASAVTSTSANVTISECTSSNQIQETTQVTKKSCPKKNIEIGVPFPILVPREDLKFIKPGNIYQFQSSNINCLPHVPAVRSSLIMNPCVSVQSENNATSMVPLMRLPLVRTPYALLTNSKPVYALQNPVPQQTFQNPVPRQTLQNPVPRQTLQNPVPRQTLQNPVPRQTLQNPVPHQTLQNPVPRQTLQNPVPRQTLQNPVPRQTLQNPVPRQALQNPVPRQTLQNPVPRQTLQNPVPRQTLYNPVHDQILQNPVPRPTLQNSVLFQTLQNPVPHPTLQNPGSLQTLHNPVSLQTLQNPGSLQTLQNPVSLQTLQNPVSLQTLQNPVSLQTLQNPVPLQTVPNPITCPIYQNHNTSHPTVIQQSTNRSVNFCKPMSETTKEKLIPSKNNILNDDDCQIISTSGLNSDFSNNFTIIPADNMDSSASSIINKKNNDYISRIRVRTPAMLQSMVIDESGSNKSSSSEYTEASNRVLTSANQKSQTLQAVLSDHMYVRTERNTQNCSLYNNIQIPLQFPVESNNSEIMSCRIDSSTDSLDSLATKSNPYDACINASNNSSSEAKSPHFKNCLPEISNLAKFMLSRASFLQEEINRMAHVDKSEFYFKNVPLFLENCKAGITKIEVNYIRERNKQLKNSGEPKEILLVRDDDVISIQPLCTEDNCQPSCEGDDNIKNADKKQTNNKSSERKIKVTSSSNVNIQSNCIKRKMLDSDELSSSKKQKVDNISEVVVVLERLPKDFMKKSQSVRIIMAEEDKSKLNNNSEYRKSIPKPNCIRPCYVRLVRLNEANINNNTE